ncbi:MAG: VOC family protein [Bryobacteraceae bacterium]|nr:VOC family protein [Bryobacteraceae bacterium]
MPADGFAGLEEIGQIALSVRDLPRAVAFYRDTLGLPYLFDAPNLAFFRMGTVRLMIAAAEEGQSASASILYFKVPEIHAAHTALTARGVSFVREPHLLARLPDHELWMAFFRDPEQNVMALMSEVRG